ncbi:ParD-like family protein [Pseudomonas huanghezhanensis]|uniref:ParD-like family protein n=1 Tax=Pseudomonas huanghezhanensis TaxID=3002903 RepID=UPI0022867971|nr:ParD-like family protein [Pseudomonas sp. BSw22131]
MGLVKISEQMHANIRSVSAALSRSINAQAEHWMRIGMLAELHPGLNYSEICQLLIRLEASGGVLSSLPSDDFNPSIMQSRAVSQ